ncbi:hypothetical protein ACHAQA_008429 [Verticillium albo-atrum]
MSLPSVQLPLLDGYEANDSLDEFQHLRSKGRSGVTHKRNYSWVKAILAAILLLIGIVVFFFPDDTRHYLHLPPPSSGHHTPTRDHIQDIITSIVGESPAQPPNSTDTTADPIPNYAHFVYILKDPNADFHFEFSHYLSIYAATHHWRPEIIYFHTNARPKALDRARSGKSGHWNRLIFALPGLTVRQATVPTHAGNGVAIVGMEHKSDFVRVKAVHELGGVYIDWDVHALRDLTVLREGGFQAVAGRQAEGDLNSGTFLAAKGSRLTELWMEGMNAAYDGKWETHSNGVLTAVAERLVREEGEALIVEREAFAPGGWSTGDVAALFAPHAGEKSNLEGKRQGDKLPDYGEGPGMVGEAPMWAKDWSYTYLLHAFRPGRVSHKPWGFEAITPRYVLERQSNFARAVYPVVKEMYDRKIIEIDDPHEG